MYTDKFHIFLTAILKACPLAILVLKKLDVFLPMLVKTLDIVVKEKLRLTLIVYWSIPA